MIAPDRLRAWRKKYTHELEKELHRDEQEGIHAFLESQRAAKRVAGEKNKRD
jgi:hypothetical protein